jgi:ABC-type lipoprotein release transport system permease subunit
MSPVVWMLIGMALGATGALAGVWYGFGAMLTLAERIDAEVAKEEG